MKKYNLYANCKFITGYLRYGHMEGTIEVESEEELDKIINNDEIEDYMYTIVDDYEINEHEIDLSTLKYKLVDEY